jgi:4-amino-4-deoxy-L-arabinose transferase-like glycosyltransferase
MIKKPLFKKLIFLIFFILFGVIAPICYLSRPLFADESVYLAIGNFVRNGALLYRDVADVKPPGIYYLAALVFSVAGKSFIAARVLTFVVNIASALLVLILGTKIKDKNVGMLASILFLISAYLPLFQGYYYLAEPFAVFFILLSVLFFLKEGHRSKFIAGLTLGIGL